MTKVIIIQGQGLESYFDETMDRLYAKYHSHPSDPNAPTMTPEEAAEMAAYERLAEDNAANANNPNGVPIGKLVI